MQDRLPINFKNANLFASLFAMCYYRHMEYKLIRQERKTLALMFERDGNLIVKAPMKLSENDIQKFVLSKSKWIEKQRGRFKNVDAFKSTFDFSNYIYLYGEKLAFQDVDMGLLIGDMKDKERKLVKFYHEQAEKTLPQIAKELSASSGLKYKTIKLSSSRRNWGSYDREGNMKLNFRLVMLPRPIIEYVVLHELCHGKQLNHSPAFYAELTKYCPNCKELKANLATYGFILNL